MVHGIVTAHHGAIELQSTPGQGSCFHVYLPLLAAGAAPDATIGAPAAEGLRGHGERIMYIDDDEVMRLMVERLLARAGYSVTSHDSALAALATLGADPGACELVITDFNMPELSGLEVGRRLAALRPGLPVLIISGYLADDLAAQARSHGVRGLVRKENVLEELVPAIARALGKAPA
jgi:CheY-like chemotaxis protein